MIFLNKEKEKLPGIPDWEKFTICIVHPFNECTTFYWLERVSKGRYALAARGVFSFVIKGSAGLPLIDNFKDTKKGPLEVKEIRDLIKEFDVPSINIEFPVSYDNMGRPSKIEKITTDAYVLFIEGKDDGRQATTYIKKNFGYEINKEKDRISKQIDHLRGIREENEALIQDKNNQFPKDPNVRRATTILRVFHEVRMEVIAMRDQPGDYDPNTAAFFKEMEEEGTFMMVKSSKPEKDKYHYAVALKNKCTNKTGKIKKRIPKKAILIKDSELGLDFSKDPVFRNIKIERAYR